MRILIETIPHKNQRYDTVGDYFIDKDKTIHIKISEAKRKQDEFLILIHELVELTLVIFRGIKIKDIDEFDMSFQGEGEPGDSLNAPYHLEHKFATDIEKLVCKQLNIDWDEYNQSNENLS